MRQWEQRYDHLVGRHERRRWHDVAYWGLLLVACAVFYWMNLLTTFKEDDMLHSLVSGDLTHINSLSDLLHSYWNKYFILNGRTSDMVAEGFCAFLGKPLFDVCNTIVFALMAHLVSLLSTGHRSVMALALFLACIGTCFPVPGETMLWLAGSCNYMWTVTAALGLVYFLLHHQSGHIGWGKGVLLFLAALIAGAGNEATSFACMAAFVLFFLFNRSRLDKGAVIVLAGYAMGVLLIVGSPAAWRRVGAEVVTDLPLLDLFYHRLHVTGMKMVTSITPAVALLLLAIALPYRGFKFLKSSVWTWLLLCSTLLMLGLGLQMQRPLATLATVGLVVIINLADYLLRRNLLLRLMTVVVALVASSVTWGQGITVMRQYQDYSSEVKREVIASPRQAVLHQRHFNASNRFVYAAHFSSTDFFNNHYIWRYYYDKENVQFVPDSVYNRYHEGRLMDGAIPMPFHDDHGGLVDQVVAFPNQDYMLAALHLDTVPNVFQVGRSFYRSQSALTPQEKMACITDGDGTPCRMFCYYPLRYQGQVLYVLPIMDDNDTCVLVLLDLFGANEMRLRRTAPNPAGVFKKPSQQ